MNNSRKNILALTIVFMMLFSLLGCGSEIARNVNAQWPQTDSPAQNDTITQQLNEQTTGAIEKSAPNTWAIYWYLCGSDLETYGGFATQDLEEMMRVTLPDNVQVVIETGGAQEWQNDTINANALSRYLYSGNTLTKISEEPDANMSDPNTLTEFLQYCNINYPAERQAVILWDHGGGSLGGVICDERASGDSISLPQLKSALEAAPASSGKYELIGFDACLMATIETMDAIGEHARYMVAAEESEPGCGWEYSGLFSALVSDTIVDGATLGKAICDTYYAGCEAEGSQAMTTLSVLDLNKAPAMIEAFQNLGNEALLASINSREEYLSMFGNAALNSENYGGNNRQTGYFNMMDIGDFVENAGEDLFPKTYSTVRAALTGLVVYQVKGELRSRANGLACYYSYDSDLDAFNLYTNIANFWGFKFFYEYALTGDLSAEGRAYVKSIQLNSGEAETPVQPLTPSLGQQTFALSTSQNGRYILDIGTHANNLAGVYLHVMYFAEYDGHIEYIDDLGTSHAIDVSRQNEGVFTDTFDGKWAAGRDAGFQAYSNPIFLAVADRLPGTYTIYVTPIMLGSEANIPGEDYLLYLYFDETTEQYEILGAKKPMDEQSGMADKELRKLAPGDILIPVPRMAWRLADSSFTELSFIRPDPDDVEHGRMFILTENAEFYNQLFLDGYYRITFEMVDFSGRRYESEPGWYRCDENGNPVAIHESQVPDISGVVL